MYTNPIYRTARLIARKRKKNKLQKGNFRNWEIFFSGDVISYTASEYLIGFGVDEMISL